MALFVISGASAAGKSTVARLLAERFARGVCVHGDDIRAMMVSGRAEMRPDAGEEALRHLTLRYAGALAVAEVFLKKNVAESLYGLPQEPILQRTAAYAFERGTFILTVHRFVFRNTASEK